MANKISMVGLTGKQKNELFKRGLYTSYNDRINDPDSPNGINQEGLDEVMDEMYQEEWVEVKPQDVKVGQRIRYLLHTKDDTGEETGKLKFVAGGFIKKIDTEIGSISYLSKKIWGVYWEDIYRVWVKDGRPNPPGHTKNKAIRYKKPAEGHCTYEVRIGDVVVYRTNDKSKYNAVLQTKKYKTAVATGIFYVDTE